MEETRQPVYHVRLMPYFVVKTAAAFIQFMKDVFEAEEVFAEKRSDGNDLILHAEMKLEGAAIMLCDSTDDYLPNRICYLFMCRMQTELITRQ